jgi:hypothetical protein
MRKETNSYGDIRYYNDLNQYHREDGPAIEYTDGSKWWYLNGQRHREDGPAIEWDNGTKWWYLNGLCHREDGPAIEYANGDKRWYFRGKHIDCKTNKEFLQLMKMKAFW